MRAAVVIEQCWHRVPGGTASAVIDQVAAVAAHLYRVFPKLGITSRAQLARALARLPNP